MYLPSFQGTGHQPALSLRPFSSAWTCGLFSVADHHTFVVRNTSAEFSQELFGLGQSCLMRLHASRSGRPATRHFHELSRSARLSWRSLGHLNEFDSRLP